MTPEDLARHLGEKFEFELEGRRSHYRLIATVVTASSKEIRLETGDGRRLTIPTAVIRSVTPIARASRPAQRSQEAGIGTATSANKAVMANRMRTAVQAAEAETDPLKRVKVIRAQVGAVGSALTPRINRARADALIALAERVERQLQCDSQASASALRPGVLTAIRNARSLRSHGAKPQSLPGDLERLLTILIEVERAHWESQFDGTLVPPQITTRDRVNVTRGSDSEFDLPIRISLDPNAADVRSVRLVLDKFRSLKIIGAPPRLDELHAGQAVTLTARMRDVRKQGSKADVRIDAHLTFKDQLGKSRQSPRQTLDLRIAGKEVHAAIPNPFRAYAGGLPVEKPEMFFGRQQLIQEFVRELAKPAGGMCYALYGQQRTGKSSVLGQVTSRLIERGAVVASLSMGTIDRRSMTVDFIEEILDQFRVQIDAVLPGELSGRLFASWPDSAAIEKRPLRSLQRAREAARTILRAAGRTGVPFVVVVDEFTYLHEVLRRRGMDPREYNELRDFMRQLKGLLETRIFSALLVGQDTMPRFLDAYPNEFSVMATRKLDYLSHEETQALADEPVRTPNKSSRYSGYALSTIAALTDGHPFFTQILCDRTITLVNTRKRSDITQSDVEEAAESLISGQDCIEAHKFDCFVSADNTHALISDMDGEFEEDASRHAVEVLARIARMSGSQNNAVPIEDLQLDLKQREALTDLRMRGVIRETDSGVAIRVLLYADYLRRRQA